MWPISYSKKESLYVLAAHWMKDCSYPHLYDNAPIRLNRFNQEINLKHTMGLCSIHQSIHIVPHKVTASQGVLVQSTGGHVNWNGPLRATTYSEPEHSGSSLHLLKQLHWLLVEWRIKYKIATLTFKALETGQPPYLILPSSYQSFTLFNIQNYSSSMH